MRHVSPVSRMPQTAQDDSFLEKFAALVGVVDNVSTILNTIAGILVAKEAAGTGGTE